MSERLGRFRWLCFLALAGCSLLRGGEAGFHVDRIAVLPVERHQGSDQLPAHAGEVVTAQIYAELANRHEIPFVPDLDVAATLPTPALRDATERRARAVALGKQLGADAVLTGEVTVFRERVGTALGARSPASVSFMLELIEVSSGARLWTGRFEETQESLSSNVFDFWMFWRAGPHWLTAAELSRLGVAGLIEELAGRMK